MADHRNADTPRASDVPASQSQSAVSRTAGALLREIDRRLDPEILGRLERAALDPLQQTNKSTIADLIADGVRREDIADFYIPAVSRVMGEKWCTDQMSFASVTIGASRLQGMLRELGPNWSGDISIDAAAPSVLVAVPQEVHHTLGALVLSGQLRRMGVSVKLSLGERAETLAHRLRQTRYAAVFISASQSENLETLRRIIDVINGTVDNAPPIVIGGGILETRSAETIIALTGASSATSKTEEALRLCGIKAPTHVNRTSKNGV